MQLGDEKCEWLRNSPVYVNKHVKIGLWYDESASHEVKMRELWYSFLRNETTTQIVNQVYGNFYKTVKLPSDSHNILFGQLIQLKSPCLMAYNGERGLALSVTLAEGDLDVCPRAIKGTQLTASIHKAPCVRNTFQILPVDLVASGELLKSKDRFMLKTLSGEAGEQGMFVECEPARWGDPRHPLNLPTLTLTPHSSEYCWWYAMHRPRRGESRPKEGVPIGVGDNVIIRQVMNNEALAVDKEMLYGTFFGNEYGVTAHNRHGRFDLVYPENIWEFITDYETNFQNKSP